ncbi:ABC transporter permease, partial [bacterium]|nr:ABC transporter permease [bacterium]
VRSALIQIAYVAAALALCAIVVAAAGRDPVLALRALFSGAFASPWGFLNACTKTVPLLLTGLAVLVAFRAGFWNIGAEGQFILGAIAAAALGTVAIGPAVVHVPLILLGAAAAGAGWCLLAAWLRVKRGALEVISTILLNFVALYLLSWLVHGPLMQASGAQPIGDEILPTAVLPRIVSSAYPLHAGLPLALLAVLVVALLLERTETGFRLRMVGANPEAARWAGIPVERTVFLTAAASGALAGLAGAVEILGVLGRLYDKVSPGYGFTAIAVALLARLRPLALIPAAFFFGALEAGSSRMQQEADVSYVLVLVVQAVVIVASIASGLRLARREEA